MVGIAVLMTVTSTAAMKVEISIADSTSRRRAGEIGEVCSRAGS